MKNPWLKPAPKHWHKHRITESQPVTVEDRCTELKKFDVAKLKAVISWEFTQKTVCLAAKRRLKKLQKKEK